MVTPDGERAWYGNRQLNNGGALDIDVTTAKLSIVSEEGTTNEKHESFIIPMRNPGELMRVKSFSY
ncbi:Uncharacterized protein conserved in bacteria [Yersinia pekkanenii]|uniref:Uncharacterized protein conserved in bacteria n=1 Tax=Yersinia pekkanenii TaxID=1288385 RepID=A0A0T9QS96_9GAMM|nr:Uncharacterized protein conserved in bacteria [Yersinia pekkanenii]CRY68935.1 Uncharacterized protein conserved in bacteria [Yersinia pekkanenii]